MVLSLFSIPNTTGLGLQPPYSSLSLQACAAPIFYSCFDNSAFLIMPPLLALPLLPFCNKMRLTLIHLAQAFWGVPLLSQAHLYHCHSSFTPDLQLSTSHYVIPLHLSPCSFLSLDYLDPFFHLAGSQLMHRLFQEVFLEARYNYLSGTGLADSFCFTFSMSSH